MFKVTKGLNFRGCNWGFPGATRTENKEGLNI